MSMQVVLRKGLYTDDKGKTVVYVVNNVYERGWDQVDFDVVRSGAERSWPLERFQRQFPNRVTKIEISFE